MLKKTIKNIEYIERDVNFFSSKNEMKPNKEEWGEKKKIEDKEFPSWRSG